MKGKENFELMFILQIIGIEKQRKSLDRMLQITVSDYLMRLLHIHEGSTLAGSESKIKLKNIKVVTNFVGGVQYITFVGNDEGQNKEVEIFLQDLIRVGHKKVDGQIIYHKTMTICNSAKHNYL